MMKGQIDRLVSEDDAQDLIEYALLCGVLAVGCITGILELTRIINFFKAVGDVLSNAI